MLLLFMKKLNLILLISFIILAVVLNFIPRVGYEYPLHVDELVHYQYANHLSDGSPLYFGGEYNSLESGFHYILAFLNLIGIPYLFMFRYLASVITILICLGVFLLTREMFNETAAVFSVLFIALLKSSVMILGPVFSVPMALGMFLIVFGLYLIKIKSKYWFLILSALLIIHPPSAMAFLLLINIEFIILAIRSKSVNGYVKNLMWEMIGGIIAIPFYWDVFMVKGVDAINQLNFIAISSALFIPRFLGWTLLLIALIGIYFATEKKNYSISSYIIGLLIFISIFYYFRVEVFIPYRRALMYLFLILAIPFGYGCEKIINLTKNKKYQIIIGIVLIAIVLITAIPSRLEESNKVYHVINDEDFEAFNFIRENTPEDAIVVIDPWKANAITPIAERQVYSRIAQGPNEEIEAKNDEIKEFFDNKCQDTGFLEENNINVVYGECEDSELVEVYENVWKYG
jgi:hypothetical protein